MTVKDLLTKGPKATLDMLTPSGYVFLPPEQTEALLAGKSTTGHPGKPEYACGIYADELLPQEITSANQDSMGVWHLITTAPDKQTAAPCKERGGQMLC